MRGPVTFFILFAALSRDRASRRDRDPPTHGPALEVRIVCGLAAFVGPYSTRLPADGAEVLGYLLGPVLLRYAAFSTRSPEPPALARCSISEVITSLLGP